MSKIRKICTRCGLVYWVANPYDGCPDCKPKSKNSDLRVTYGKGNRPELPAVQDRPEV